MRDERVTDMKKHDDIPASWLRPVGGECTVMLDAEEVLTLYSFIDCYLQTRAGVDGMVDANELVLQGVRRKLAQHIKISMRVAAAVEQLRQSDSLTTQIARGLSGAKKKTERYMDGQHEKIAALKEGCADVNDMAAQLRRTYGSSDKKIIVTSESTLKDDDMAVGAPMPTDDTMVEVDLDPFQEERVRDYPRRRPPAPIMPHMGGRRRAKRHGGSHKAV